MNSINLIDSLHVPKYMQSLCAYTQYKYLENIYKSGSKHILYNNIKIFGPFPKPEKPWDISQLEKIVIYNKDVANVNKWLKNEIFSKSALFNYKTLDVLIRIATGMLNKCDIPREVNIILHDNMVRNLKSEYDNIILSGLPF